MNEKANGPQPRNHPNSTPTPLPLRRLPHKPNQSENALPIRHEARPPRCVVAREGKDVEEDRVHLEGHGAEAVFTGGVGRVGRGGGGGGGAREGVAFVLERSS